MHSLVHGSALCAVDLHGLVAIPPFLADLLAEADAALLVARHDADPCLIGYARDHLARLAERNERRRLADEQRGDDDRAHHRRMRHSFGPVAPLERAGPRFRIPDVLRHLGRIDALALFVGTGDSFEIWNPRLALDSDDAGFRELAAYQLQAFGLDQGDA